MACDATTLEALQIAAGDDRLSQRDLLMCRAYLLALSLGVTTATTALANCQSSGDDGPSEKDLELMFLAFLSA